MVQDNKSAIDDARWYYNVLLINADEAIVIELQAYGKMPVDRLKPSFNLNTKIVYIATIFRHTKHAF